MHNIQPEMIYTKSCTMNSTCTCNVAYLVSILYDKKTVKYQFYGCNDI
jgi:hypothetical protein